MAQRWKQKPAGSNWGEFGPDDQRGRMNYVTREKVLQGIAEVKEGISFALSLPLDYPGGATLNPRRGPPRPAPPPVIPPPPRPAPRRPSATARARASRTSASRSPTTSPS